MPTAISAGAGTAAVLASGGTGATGMLAGAGASAAGSLAGAAMQGGGPPLSGGLVQRLAYGLPKGRSGGSSGEVPTARRAESRGGGSGATAAPAPKPFNRGDASNDREVQQMIDESKNKKTAECQRRRGHRCRTASRNADGAEAARVPRKAFNPTRIFVDKDRAAFLWFCVAVLAVIFAAAQPYYLIAKLKQREHVVIVDPATCYVSPLLDFQEAKDFHAQQSTLATMAFLSAIQRVSTVLTC